ncbi:Hypothetical_protein [Hexamita inflata]|uniref:Hypothetical_protein n=1 Tax=Hexamita inflata TaxID=28002 RepID=A0AA86RGG8_9EUKA|nr:Hypothetical protein HINF_LOCUS61903 [Hexamita inflata]
MFSVEYQCSKIIVLVHLVAGRLNVVLLGVCTKVHGSDPRYIQICFEHIRLFEGEDIKQQTVVHSVASSRTSCYGCLLLTRVAVLPGTLRSGRNLWLLFRIGEQLGGGIWLCNCYECQREVLDLFRCRFWAVWKYKICLVIWSAVNGNCRWSDMASLMWFAPNGKQRQILWCELEQSLGLASGAFSCVQLW